MTNEDAIILINDNILYNAYIPLGEYEEEALKKAISCLEQPEIIHCQDCKHWRQQKSFNGSPLSFGFCESDDMWRSLYGETTEVDHIDTDDNFFCGYAERRTNE